MYTLQAIWCALSGRSAMARVYHGPWPEAFFYRWCPHMLGTRNFHEDVFILSGGATEDIQLQNIAKKKKEERKKNV